MKGKATLAAATIGFAFAAYKLKLFSQQPQSLVPKIKNAELVFDYTNSQFTQTLTGNYFYPIGYCYFINLW
jgi:hypothetical protein